MNRRFALVVLAALLAAAQVPARAQPAPAPAGAAVALSGAPLVSDDGKHVVIRPLAYVRERDLARYAGLMDFPIIPCNLCGSQEHLQRRQVAEMLREWERKHPGRIESIARAIATVVPSHLMDRALFDFAAVRATGRAEPGGDTAFDVDDVLERAVDAVASVARVAVRHR